MNKEKIKLALEILKAAYVPSDLDKQRKMAITAFEAELAKPDFWEGYVPEPVKPAQCAAAEDGVCEALDCSNHKPAQQEPVAWMSPHGGMLTANYINNFASGLDKEIHNIPLCTSPPAQRKPLTDEQIAAFRRDIVSQSGVFGSVEWCNLFARAIEAAHGIKENT